MIPNIRVYLVINRISKDFHCNHISQQPDFHHTKIFTAPRFSPYYWATQVERRLRLYSASVQSSSGFRAFLVSQRATFADQESPSILFVRERFFLHILHCLGCSCLTEPDRTEARDFHPNGQGCEIPVESCHIW
jgi:hypothetical protein